MIFSEGLEGVENLPKEAVQCDFEEEFVELRILGIHNKNYRWSSSKGCLHLFYCCRAVQQNHPEDWLQLQPENKPIRPNPKSDDPSAGLMDLMRDMYQSGDDNMKKVIAEAFVREADGVEV